MIIKRLFYKDLTEKYKKDIIKLMDIFREPKGKKSIRNEDVEMAVKEKNNIIITAHEGNDIIGIIILIKANLFTAKIGIIDEVIVSEAYRGKGAASLMMDEAIKLAKENNLDLLKVDTNRDNPANRLYEKFGFKKREDNLYKLFF